MSNLKQQQAGVGSGQLGLLELLAYSGGAESLLVALTRRCDTLEAQNAVLRTKVLQLYPPGEDSRVHGPYFRIKPARASTCSSLF